MVKGIGKAKYQVSRTLPVSGPIRYEIFAPLNSP